MGVRRVPTAVVLFPGVFLSLTRIIQFMYWIWLGEASCAGLRPCEAAACYSQNIAFSSIAPAYFGRKKGD